MSNFFEFYFGGDYIDLTEILSQIDRSETYPKMLSMTLETNALYLKINTTDWTEQMLAELPSIQFDVYTNTNGTYIKYKTVTVCLDTDICNGNYAVEIKDVPNDSYLAVTPMFDNNAIESHNNLVSTGIIDSDMWDTETSSFDISISYGAEEGASPTPPSPTPEDCPFTCDIEYFLDSEKEWTINTATYKKSTDEYGVGICCTLESGGTWTAPILLSPTQTAVGYLVNGSAEGVLGGSIVYDNVTWYYSISYGQSGSYVADGMPMSTYENVSYPFSEQQILDFLTEMNVQNKS